MVAILYIISFVAFGLLMGWVYAALSAKPANGGLPFSKHLLALVAFIAAILFAKYVVGGLGGKDEITTFSSTVAGLAGLGCFVWRSGMLRPKK